MAFISLIEEHLIEEESKEMAFKYAKEGFLKEKMFRVVTKKDGNIMLYTKKQYPTFSFKQSN